MAFFVTVSISIHSSPPLLCMPDCTAQIEASSYYVAVGMAGLFAFLLLVAVTIAIVLVVVIIIIQKKAKSVERFATDLEPILQQGMLLIKNNTQIYTIQIYS